MVSSPGAHVVPSSACFTLHDNPRTQTCTLRVLAFENTTKIQREDTQERDKKSENGAGEGKKSEILGGPAEVPNQQHTTKMDGAKSAGQMCWGKMDWPKSATTLRT